MVLAPGATEGGPANRHRGSDQWLYVLSGTGQATVGGRRQRLRPGTLLLIERGTTHQIRNVGRTSLKTLNLYAPPAYTASGHPLRRGHP
jgi:mannose-6-phosphate isomerase-like protein (cupin superfamily)